MIHQKTCVGHVCGLCLVAVMVAVLTGCSTTKPVDWDSRIGTYTYEDALADLGQPSQVTNLDGSVKSVEWITARGFDNAKDSMPPVYSRGEVVTPEETYGYEAPNKVLRLMFAPDGKLIDWKRNY